MSGRPGARPWDVLVVGGGPAGSVAAALLARAGHRVLVLEKERFPRFRIGESLLPAGLPVLERLGVAPRRDTFVFKRGARFVCEATGREQSFSFDEALPGCPRHAWHVDRSRFDQQLLERAQADGAIVRQGETVVDAGVGGESSDDAAWVRTRTGTEHGRFLIDASGQARLLARRFDAARPYRGFGASAVFTHFEHLGAAAVEELGPDFDIRIMMRREGWGWVIPLPDGRLSVGMVSSGKITPAELDSGLLSGPLVTRLTAGASRLRTRVVGNFSYRNAVPSGRRYATVGDAACFLDPVFSSGVTLALRSAAGVADVLGPALEQNREATPDLLADHGASMERAYRTFAALIHRFYNTRLAESMFLGDLPDYALRRGVMSVLAGDVWRYDNAFQDMLLSGRSAHRRSSGRTLG